MTFQHLWIIPILSTVFALAAFIAGYAIAVGNGTEKAWFSYISDGGAHPPESCIFGQLLNISALFTAIAVYLRHRQYVVYYKNKYHVYDGWWRTCSLVLLWIGWVLSFGVSIVANFQETSVAVCHFIGAMMAFFGGVIYIWGQIMLSYAVVPAMTPSMMNHLRVVVNSLATGALVLHLVCEWAQPFVQDNADGTKPTKPPKDDGITKLDPSSPYYTNHLVTTIAEWVLAVAMELIVLSFAWELRHFEYHMPKMYFRDEIYPVPIEGNKINRTNSILGNGFPFKPEDESNVVSATQIPRPRLNGQNEGTYTIQNETRSPPENADQRNEYAY